MGKPSILSRLTPLLEKRRTPAVWALLAVVLTSPSILSGYYQDDHLIRLRFQGFPNLPGVKGAVLDTCVFGDGDPEQNRVRMERGIWPWWTPEDWKIAFWRPLCSLTHWADWRIFGDRAWLMHLHSILWYGLLVYLLALLYRRLLMPPWVAGLAGLLFLLDAAHAFPVSWIATRNAALSSVFIVLVLYFHDRWRRDAWRPGMPAALAALALGLLGSEATVASGAYLAAYALFVDRAPWSKRIGSLLPYLLVVVVWRAVYDALGYGVSGTLLYIDPLHQPVELAWGVLRHLPILLFTQFAASDATLSNFLPPLGIMIYLCIAAVFLLAMAYVLWPLLRNDRVARFWALGMMLSALPVCTTMPQGRELMNPSIGAMALIAQFLAFRASSRRENERRGYRMLAGGFAGLWVFLHLIVSSVSLPVSSYATLTQNEQIAVRLNATAPADSAIRSQTLLTVSTPADLLAATLPIMRAAANEPVPQYGRVLSAGVRHLEVTRTDERTLRLRMDDGFMTRPWCQVFRNPVTHPMKKGDTIRLTGLTVEVAEVTNDGRPVDALFRFDVPLEDPSLRWVVFKDVAYVPFTPPAIGETVQVKGPAFADIVRWFLTQ
jgi:hypothetical protein